MSDQSVLCESTDAIWEFGKINVFDDEEVILYIDFILRKHFFDGVLCIYM